MTANRLPILDGDDRIPKKFLDSPTAELVADQTSEVYGELITAIVDKQSGLSLAPATDASNALLGANPALLDPLNDGYIYAAPGSALYRATDVNGPWTTVKDFAGGGTINGIRDAGDGEVLLSRTGDGIWKSSGWATNPLTATWAQVLVTNAQVTPFGFDVDPVSGWAFCTTYIGSGDMSPSRYFWLSQDNGDTWTMVYDTAVAHPALDQQHAHNHMCVIDYFHDPVTPRLVASYHKTGADPTDTADPLKRIIYSTDAGVTWSTLSAEVIQPEAGIATEAGVIFDTDTTPQGLYIWRRGAADIEPLFLLRRTGSAMTGFATRAIRGSNGAVHFAFRSTVPGESGAVVTTDGYRATETVTIEPADPTDAVDVTNITVYKDELYVGFRNTVTETATPRRLTATEPQRGTPPLNDTGGVLGGQAENLGHASGLGAFAKARGAASGVLAWAAERAVANGFLAKALADLAVTIGNESEAAEQGVNVGGLGKAGYQAVNVATQGEASGTGSTNLAHQGRALHTFSVNLAYNDDTTADGQLHLGGKHIEWKRVAVPAAPAAEKMREFLRHVTVAGVTKVQRAGRFPTGPIVNIATEGSAYVGTVASTTGTLIGGTKDFADTAVTANSHIEPEILTPGGTPGSVYLHSKTAGVGYTIKSTSAADASVVVCKIVAY